MIIKKYKCNTFAGIKNQDIDFIDGMNVILGPNEAGKSTIVEGVHSILFKSVKLNNKSSEDKNFRTKFMPVDAGDSIDGDLILSNLKDEYYLSKEWGAQPSSKLILPGEEILKNEDSVNEKIKELLIFGEGTYSSFFFSRQVYLKEAIKRITDNKEAIGEVSTFLRKIIMELDGISIDDLKQKIDYEIDKTLKRWDIDKNYPENNRGINNSYKTGFGEIVESFYNKERIRIAMDAANEAENQFNRICNQIKEVEDDFEILKSKKEILESMEDDVITRATIEPKIELLKNEMGVHIKINQEWPTREAELKNLEIELKRLKKEQSKLQKEKELSYKTIEKDRYSKILVKAENLKNKLSEKEKEIKLIINITKEDIESLEFNYNKMNEAEAMMKAGVMIGKIVTFNSDSDLIITQDLNNPKKISSGDNFRANGYIKIESENLIEIEIKSGDIDFVDLRNKYIEYKKNLELLFDKFDITAVHEAKSIKDKRDNLNTDIKSVRALIESILGDNTYESLKKKVDDYGDLSGLRNSSVIESELLENNIEIVETLSNIKSIKNILEKFEEEYITNDKVLDIIIDIKMSLRKINDDFLKLKPMPVEYSSTNEFRNDLSNTRVEYEKYQNRLIKLKEEYHDSELSLQGLSYEELFKEYREEEIQFNKKLKYGNKLLKIKSVFDSTLEHMDESSFNSLTELFSGYFSLLTNGNYKSVNIDNDFNFKIYSDKNIAMPISLLSAGTYDSIALALKLSILEHILGNNKGFIILDDCLVDLDPVRKSTAIELINKFSNKHQVIFTTCNPETAKELGGNLIVI